MRALIFAILLSLSSLASAQVDPQITLSYERYMEMVRKNHPLSAAAELEIDRGDAILRSARGGFDPVLAGSLNSKDFDGTEYYDLLEGGLKIPTWLGLTIDAGYEQNDGIFLNPENSTPDNGLLYAGISLPIGQGLFIDGRRAAFRKAKVAQELAEAQRELLLNELILEAGSDYWEWFAAYHSKEVYREALILAQQRLDAVIQAATLGDRPFIDTLEASIQVQNRILSQQQAQLDVLNARAAMSVNLWLDGYIPMEVADNTVPLGLDNVPVERAEQLSIQILDSLVMTHPLLETERGEIARSEIDRQWKSEQIKPVLDVKYNALTESVRGGETQGFNSRDYELGMVFKMPILLRKERGSLQLAQIKIEESKFKLADKQQDIWLNARTAINSQNTTADQVELYDRTVEDYSSLLSGERDLFSSGESSLFLVNRRELGYVQARIKQIELISKNRMSALKTQYALSTLNQEQ